MSLNILIVDAERVRLRSLQWWLTRLGHRVTSVVTDPSVRNVARGAYDLRLLDPRLLQAPWLPDDDTPGVIWSMHAFGVVPGNPGRRVATHCPCPASPGAAARLVNYVLHPDTAEYLDAAMLGELLGTPRASPATLVTRFLEDATALTARLRAEATRGDLEAARVTGHTLRGCAAAVGAIGMLRILARFDTAPGLTFASIAEQVALEVSVQATARSLERALEVYREPSAPTERS